jgi:HAD superfamily hydrolase (TIGR01549 family)
MTSHPDISVCIWDFDGTLYKPTPELDRAIIEADYILVMKHTGWSREKTVTEFHKIFKVVTPSSTETAARLAGISVKEAAIECEQYKDRRLYLSYDDKLVAAFATLTRFTHYLLVNGISEKVSEGLAILGLSPSLFKEIVTAEIVGVNKPQLNGFRYILEKTGLPPQSHIMIGDREAVDLVPAKSVGMQTCLVSWGVTKPKTDSVDTVIEDIYTLPTLLL